MKSLFLPPALQIILLLIAVLLWFRWQPLSFLLVVVATASLYLFSTRPVATALMAGLERGVTVPSEQAIKSAQAIVVLGTGVLSNTPEYDHMPQPGALLLQRLRYGLKLAKERGYPVLVTGGRFMGVQESEVMAAWFREQGVPVRWQESKSLSTRSNAQYSAAILQPDNISRILLVSHSWHLRRAEKYFQSAGLEVVNAPTAWANGHKPNTLAQGWIPHARWLRLSQLALHEYAGLLWYHLGR